MVAYVGRSIKALLLSVQKIVVSVIVLSEVNKCLFNVLELGKIESLYLVYMCDVRPLVIAHVHNIV